MTAVAYRPGVAEEPAVLARATALPGPASEPTRAVGYARANMVCCAAQGVSSPLDVTAVGEARGG
jgi:hypothetical protein